MSACLVALLEWQLANIRSGIQTCYQSRPWFKKQTKNPLCVSETKGRMIRLVTIRAADIPVGPDRASKSWCREKESMCVSSCWCDSSALLLSSPGTEPCPSMTLAIAA